MNVGYKHNCVVAVRETIFICNMLLPNELFPSISAIKHVIVTLIPNIGSNTSIIRTTIVINNDVTQIY